MFDIRTIILFTSILAISKAIDPNNICCLLRDGSKIVDDTDCSSYYTCKNAKATKSSCPKGYNFNKNAQTCQPQSQFQCGSVVGNPCDGVSAPKFVSNPNSCNGYFYCVNGAVSHTSSCPGDLYFDEENQRCDYKENVGCNVLTGASDKVVCSYVEDNQYFGSASSCDGWTKCKNGKPATGTCKNPYIFNVQKRECDFKDNYKCPQLGGDPNETGEGSVECTATEEGEIKQSGDSCSSYLKCDGKKYVKFQCQAGYFYEPDTDKCKKRLDAVTFPGCNRCEGTNLDFVNVVDDNCQGYVRCKNGKQSTGDKCKPDYFFDETFGGCTSKNPKHRVCIDKCDDCAGTCVTQCEKEDCDCVCTECESGLPKCKECDPTDFTEINICNTPGCKDDDTCVCTCAAAECNPCVGDKCKPCAVCDKANSDQINICNDPGCEDDDTCECVCDADKCNPCVDCDKAIDDQVNVCNDPGCEADNTCECYCEPDKCV